MQPEAPLFHPEAPLFDPYYAPHPSPTDSFFGYPSRAAPGSYAPSQGYYEESPVSVPASRPLFGSYDGGEGPQQEERSPKFMPYSPLSNSSPFPDAAPMHGGPRSGASPPPFVETMPVLSLSQRQAPQADQAPRKAPKPAPAKVAELPGSKKNRKRTKSKKGKVVLSLDSLHSLADPVEEEEPLDEKASPVLWVGNISQN